MIYLDIASRRKSERACSIAKHELCCLKLFTTSTRNEGHGWSCLDDLVSKVWLSKKKVANYISSIDRLGWFIVYIVACSVNLSAFSTPEKDQNYKERFNRSCTKVILINLCAKLLDSLIDIFDLIRHIWPYKCVWVCVHVCVHAERAVRAYEQPKGDSLEAVVDADA